MSEAKKWVLYLEDEIELAEEVIIELEYNGFHVVHCASYRESVLKANMQKFDIIIADIHLEKGTGDKVIQVIKNNPHHMNFRTPVMILSSNITKNIISNVGKDLVAAKVKPYSISELVGSVKTIVFTAREMKAS